MPRRALTFLLALLAVLGLSTAARAQMVPVIPGPVTTSELVHYADMLELSDDQRLLALDIHDEYRAKFRKLEDDYVKPLIDDFTGMMRTMMGSGFQIPERALLEDLIEQANRIIARAKVIDRSLFDQLATILTESALEKLPTVRIERELAIYYGDSDGDIEFG